MTIPGLTVGSQARDKRQLYENIRIMLETDRSSFTSLWRDLNDFILPTRGRFQSTDSNRGDRRNNKILDNTASVDARTLGSGMSSGITSAARPWFRLTTPDPDMAEHGAVKEWLYVVTERMRWVLARSNFYNKCPTLYGDLGVFGTGAMMEVEDDHRVVRFIDLPVGSYAVANGADDTPAIITRLFRMSVLQMVTEFGLDNVSSAVKSNWVRGSNTQAMYDVVHVVLKNDENEPLALHSRENKPWSSCYYEVGAPKREGQSQFLRMSGFDEMPFMVPVWETTGEDVYGTSCPGMIALGDTRMLQTMEKRGLQGLEKMVNPPMQGPTSLKSVRTSILPGDITFVDVREGQGGFKPAHETQIRLDQLDGKQNQVRGRIHEAFFSDLFQMMKMMDENDTNPTKTAAEIYERHEEKMQVLGPVLEQLNVRWLDPTIHRTFSIMQRRGFIPSPPPGMKMGGLKVEYISMMHQAQKSSQMGGFNTLITFATSAHALDPSATDKLNMDKIMEHVNESAGNPPDVINPQEIVDQIRQARAKAAQEDRQMKQMESQAKAAKSLAQADTAKKNALTDLTSNPDVNLPGSPLGGGNVPT